MSPSAPLVINNRLTAAEAERFIREPGDLALLNAIVSRVVAAYHDASRESRASEIKAACDALAASLGDADRVGAAVRSAVEQLAVRGNPRAVAALLFESRLAEDSARTAFAIAVESLPARESRTVLERDVNGKLMGARTVAVDSAAPT